MDQQTIGLTFETLGEIFLGLTVLRVHWRVLREHKIDQAVMKTMKKEQVMGASGVFLIIIGYLIQVF